MLFTFIESQRKAINKPQSKPQSKPVTQAKIKVETGDSDWNKWALMRPECNGTIRCPKINVVTSRCYTRFNSVFEYGVCISETEKEVFKGNTKIFSDLLRS